MKKMTSQGLRIQILNWRNFATFFEFSLFDSNFSYTATREKYTIFAIHTLLKTYIYGYYKILKIFFE